MTPNKWWRACNEQKRGKRRCHRNVRELREERRGSNCILAGMNADEKPIEAVREYPCLWLVNSKTYNDAVAKGNAWKEVASQGKATVCRSVGRNLR